MCQIRLSWAALHVGTIQCMDYNEHVFIILLFLYFFFLNPVDLHPTETTLHFNY